MKRVVGVNEGVERVDEGVVGVESAMLQVMVNTGCRHWCVWMCMD